MPGIVIVAGDTSVNRKDMVPVFVRLRVIHK